jgi:hypothetical protein
MQVVKIRNKFIIRYIGIDHVNRTDMGLFGRKNEPIKLGMPGEINSNQYREL